MEEAAAADQKAPSRLASVWGGVAAVAAGLAVLAGATQSIDVLHKFAFSHFPAVCKSADLPNQYKNATASFARTGDDWEETTNGMHVANFETSSVDKDYVYIIDRNRLKDNDKGRPPYDQNTFGRWNVTVGISQSFRMERFVFSQTC